MPNHLSQSSEGKAFWKSVELYSVSQLMAELVMYGVEFCYW